MPSASLPQVDVVVLTRHQDQLQPTVVRALDSQRDVQLVVHRIVGQALPADRGRYETIARARNEGLRCGSSPWLMFVDDDVVLQPDCVASLISELQRRPAFGALAADYLGESRPATIAPHVSMGATLFRRKALEHISFRWQDDRCECQCCCDDLRRQWWGIDYSPSARAQHLPRRDGLEDSVPPSSARSASQRAPATASPDTPSVCLIVCYLGPLPGWIHYYLQSCAFNPSLDFLIFTDQRDIPPPPANVRIEHLTADKFNHLAASKLGFPIQLSHPRKLCDFKPAYGHLFEEFLASYDYWGYTDLDVVYGDLRRYLSEARLQQFDLFTARKEFLLGHFTLFRNTSELKTLYQRSSDLPATLQSPDVLGFDECGRQWWRRLEGKPLTSDAYCDSMTHIVLRQQASRQLSVCFWPGVLEWPELPAEGWRLRWKSGRLERIAPRREAMYVHFHGFKHSAGFQHPPSCPDPRAFDITPNGIEVRRLKPLTLDAAPPRVLSPR
jgi:glycosyltransferase involved in cell wall biosynthesis